jgi:hypothetical protein
MQTVLVCMVDMGYNLRWWIQKDVPKPKNKGVVKMIVRERTFASRNSGMMHPRKTISSDAGPYSKSDPTRSYNNISSPSK